MLNGSDCRFVLDWITKHSAEGQVALNHTSVEGGSYSEPERYWRLDVRDQLTGDESHVTASSVVNCACHADAQPEAVARRTPRTPELTQPCVVRGMCKSTS